MGEENLLLNAYNVMKLYQSSRCGSWSDFFCNGLTALRLADEIISVTGNILFFFSCPSEYQIIAVVPICYAGRNSREEKRVENVSGAGQTHIRAVLAKLKH